MSTTLQTVTSVKLYDGVASGFFCSRCLGAYSRYRRGRGVPLFARLVLQLVPGGKFHVIDQKRENKEWTICGRRR